MVNIASGLYQNLADRPFHKPLPISKCFRMPKNSSINEIAETSGPINPLRTFKALSWTLSQMEQLFIIEHCAYHGRKESVTAIT